MYEFAIDIDRITEQAEVEIDIGKCKNPVDVEVLQNQQEALGILTDGEVLALLNGDD